MRGTCRRERLVLFTRDLLVTCAILLLCTLIGLLFLYVGFDEANMISVYILGVLLVSSVTNHKVYGMASAVAGVFLFNCIFADPKFNLFYYDRQYTIVAVLMLVASLTVSSFTARFRNQLRQESYHLLKTEALLETSQALIQASDPKEIIQITARQLYKILNRSIALYELRDGAYCLMDFSGSDEQRIDFQPAQEGLSDFLSHADLKQHPVFFWRGQKMTFLSLCSHSRPYGLAGILTDQDEQLTPDVFNLLHAVVDETTLVLDKFELNQLNQHIALEAQTEHLRANLLRAISHDLRTPLTSISGNADILLSRADTLERPLRQKLYQDIHEDAEWLIQLVENLLFITKLENGSMELHQEPELLQEIISEAVAHMDKRKKEHTISIDLTDDLLSARADPILITQVLINLIDNALKYTPPDSLICISAFQRGGDAIVEVSDNGHGLADKTHLFELFHTSGTPISDTRRGIGLGLGLCKAIVNAHGGQIYARDNNPRGLVIGFTLPAERVCLP